MQRNFLQISVTNNDKIANILKRLPKPVGDAVADAIAEYMIKVYRDYPPYKRVSRRRAFGRTFQSEKQRRYFFWALKQGIIQIGNHRTGRLAFGWKQQGKGQNSTIVNDTPYSAYVQGDQYIQSNMMNIIGWERFDDAYEKRFAKPGIGTASKVVYIAIKKAIEKMGLKVE